MFRLKLCDSMLPALLLALLFCAGGLWGCAAARERWTGSVDTVFKYSQNEARTVVLEVPPGSLSAEAGLQPGDILLAVDGVELASASYEVVKAALRGPVGTLAALSVKRGDAVLDIKVERTPVGYRTPPESRK